MFKCTVCNEKEFDQQRKLNLHMYHCKIKNNVSRETNNQDPGEKECIHDWRLLNGSIAIEKRAIQNGYAEVCRKCQNVQ